MLDGTSKPRNSPLPPEMPCFSLSMATSPKRLNKSAPEPVERKSPTSLGSHHWITIRRMEIRSGSAVGIKAFTSGETYEGWFEMQSFLPVITATSVHSHRPATRGY